ncbi:MAG: STAS domain-containing protein [Nocardioidaceae bacterium]
MTSYDVYLGHNPDGAGTTSPSNTHANDLLTLSTDRATSGVAVVHVAGELDMSTAPRFEQGTRQVVDAGTCGLVLDLRELGFLGAAGLTGLFGLVDTPQLTCRFVVTARIVLRVLEIGDPTGRIQLAADVSTAVRECTTAHAAAYGRAS